MIVTDTFVMINFPKTGTTFCRNAMQRIRDCTLTRSNPNKIEWIMYKLGLKRKPHIELLALPNEKDKKTLGKLDEHGMVCQIPMAYRDRPIMSVTRNVFE